MSYRLADTVPADIAAQYSDLHPVTVQLLYNRGITEPDDVRVFLSPDYISGRHDPFLLNDMERAVQRVLAAVASGERIVVYSDYDCDGIPGAVILHDLFAAIGYGNVEHYIPHRHYEGFGLSRQAVEKIAAAGPALVITVDCGTADAEAVDAAVALGLDVIVTDHHEPNGVAVNACAVVNPKIGDTYPFKELCGAGVAFKLAEAVIARGNFSIPAGTEKWWLDMVGIATVGDMVPLVHENRVLAHYGLTVLRKSRRPGLQQLLRRARADQRYLTEDDIGFTIAPRINAASRMDTPEDAFHMLASRDEGEAGARVAHLERLNNERKGLVASMTKELKKRIADMATVPEVLVMGSPEWRPALAGLAANSLAESYRRPAFVWGRDGNGMFKGSCRSEGSTSVVTLMNAVADLFAEHGGHHMSGGFTVKNEHIHAFPSALNRAYRDLGAAAAVDEEVIVDATMTLDAVTSAFTDALATLAPYGVGNPKPLFMFPDVVPAGVETFGKSKEHLKLSFDTKNGPLEAIAFFTSPDAFSRTPVVGQPLCLYAHVERSFFMGRRATRLRIVDIA